MQRKYLIARTLTYAYPGDRGCSLGSRRFLVAAYDSLQYDFSRTDTIFEERSAAEWDATETTGTMSR